jgi:hypothetical protein
VNHRSGQQYERLATKNANIHFKFMKRQITRAAARAFKKRWGLIAGEEKKQLRKTSIARKLQQLNALMAWGEHFGWNRSGANRVEEVRSRWARIRRVCRG